MNTPYWVTFVDNKGKRTVLAYRVGNWWAEWYRGTFLCYQKFAIKVEEYKGENHG